MKKRNIIFIFFLLILGTIITRCNKTELNEIQIQDNNTTTEINVSDLPILKVEDGMLIFKDENQFYNTISLLTNSDETLVREWEKSIGFMSINTLQEDALDELNDSNNIEISLWLKEHNDLFEMINNENGEQEVVPKIDDLVYSEICNKTKMYIIDNYIYYVYQNQIKIAPKDKKMELLENPNSPEFKSISLHENSLKSSPVDLYAKAYNKDYRSCFLGRRVNLEQHLKAIYSFNGTKYNYQITLETTVKGYRKISCIWVKYKTELSYRNVDGEIKYNNGESTIAFGLSDRTSNEDVYSLTHMNYVKVGTASCSDASTMVKDVSFMLDHAEGESRGTNNKWATIQFH